MSGGTALIDRGEHHRDDEADELPAVRTRQLEDATEQVAFDLLALHRLRVAVEPVDRR